MNINDKIISLLKGCSLFDDEQEIKAWIGVHQAVTLSIVDECKKFIGCGIDEQNGVEIYDHVLNHLFSLPCYVHHPDDVSCSNRLVRSGTLEVKIEDGNHLEVIYYGERVILSRDGITLVKRSDWDECLLW